jgi:hypothetical protein
MRPRTPLVLVASVSAYERHRLELVLKRTGSTLCAVADAAEARRAHDGHDGVCVLVIDSGLLEMDHDPQWRELRSRHPELGAVVRCLFAGGGIRRRDGNTLLVHPDDEEAAREAIRVLAVSASHGSAGAQ